MKTILIMYMPGHAGHMLSRLFGLSPEAMPLVNRTLLNRINLSNINKLKMYQFSNVKKVFKSWQDFHGSYVDYKDNTDVRIVNAVNGHQYSCAIYPIHPYEFHHDFQDIDDTECYYVDLDLNCWGEWVQQQQQELKFMCRPDEQLYFDQYKHLHNMKPISLTKMLGTVDDFKDEYMQVAQSMNITPVLDQAVELFNDWRSVRIPQ